MKKLVKCGHCGAAISDTAIKCPCCLKKTGVSLEQTIEASSWAKSLGLFSAGVALHAAAAASGGLLSIVTMSSYNSSLKRSAKKLKAIDMFDLSNGFLVLISETDFFIASQSWGDTSAGSGLKYNDLKSVELKDLGKKGMLLEIEYVLKKWKWKRTIKESYKFKGENAQTYSEWAYLKFKEYQT